MNTAPARPARQATTTIGAASNFVLLGKNNLAVILKSQEPTRCGTQSRRLNQSLATPPHHLTPRQYSQKMAPQVGLEPTTLRLTVAGTTILPMTVVVCRLRQ